MAGSSALYCSGNFMVVTRLRAAAMASGDGVCAGEAQIENRSVPAMINRRLDMDSSNDGSCNKTQKCNIPGKQALALNGAFFRRTNFAKLQAGIKLVQRHP